MKKIKVSKIIEAAAKNGYEWGIGAPINAGTTYCILAQTSKNLGYGFNNWGLLSTMLNNLAPGLGEKIWQYNDDYANSYEEAYQYLFDALEPFIDEEINM